jgi:hypothetical protein
MLGIHTTKRKNEEERKGAQIRQCGGRRDAGLGQSGREAETRLGSTAWKSEQRTGQRQKWQKTRITDDQGDAIGATNGRQTQTTIEDRAKTAKTAKTAN